MSERTWKEAFIEESNQIVDDNDPLHLNQTARTLASKVTSVLPHGQQTEVHMAAGPVIAGAGRAAISAAPKVLDYVKAKAPAVAARAQEIFTRSNGGDLAVAATAAAAGDAQLGGAFYETLIRAGARYDFLTRTVSGVSPAQLKQFLNNLAEVDRAEDAQVEKQALPGSNTEMSHRAKALQVVKVCRILGCTIDELNEIVQCVNTTTQSQLTELELSAISFGPLLPHIRR